MMRILQNALILSVLFAAPLSGAWSKTYTVQVDRAMMGSSTLSNFPVLIYASDPTLRSVGNGGFVTSGSGYDIVVATDASLATYVPWEVELWDASVGIIVIWAKFASVNGSGAGSNTSFAVAWGNSAVTTQQNTGSFASTNVWDSNYKGVWHLADGTTLGLTDSTTNANNGANHGLTATAGSTYLDGAAHDNNASYADVGTTGFPSGAQSWTVSAWFYSTGPGGFHTIFCACNAFTAFSGPQMTTNGLAFLAGTPGHVFGTNYTASLWNYATATYDGTNVRVYLNGAAAAGNPQAQTVNTTPTTPWIGGDGGGDFFFGNLDEVRISQGIARSGDWTLSEFNNQSAPGNITSPGFLIWGSRTRHSVRSN